LNGKEGRMPKRISITLLFTVVIAIIALFAAGEVLAQDCVGPTCCQTEGGWTVEVAAGPYAWTPTDEDWPCIIPGSNPPIYVPCYRTDYWICKPGTNPGSTCDSGGLNQLLFAVKTCSPDQIGFFPIDDFDPADPNDIYYPGKGDPTLGFLDGYLQAYVIRIEPKQDGTWSILTNTPFTDLTTMAFKAGKGRKAVEEYCAVTGLECPRTSSDAGAASSQCVLVTGTSTGDNIYMGVVRGPDGCSVDAAEVSFYINSPNCDATAPCSSGIPATGCIYEESVLGCDATGNEDAPICIDPPEEGFQFCADFGSACQECFEFRSGSPTCLKYTTSSGTRIKSCFRPDGTTCSWKKCCKSPELYPGANCG